MDKEQAKFILAGFRPDGSDAHDATFATALRMAMEDRELGNWLALERAFDADFSDSLMGIQLPDGLRDQVLDLLHSLPDPDAVAAIIPGSEDHAWSVALAAIQPPLDLRTRILAAAAASSPSGATPVTEQPVAAQLPSRSRFPRLFRVAWPAAAAAGIALALWFNPTQSEPSSTASLPVDQLQSGFIQTVASSQIRLEEFPGDHREIISHLKKRNLPCPCCLPPGLRDGQGVGCREIVINGKRGSLVCLRCSNGTMIHLATFRRADVSGDLPCRETPHFSQDGEIATARWTDSSNVFILIGHTRVHSLATLF
jgi:hypothetical protein